MSMLNEYIVTYVTEHHEIVRARDEEAAKAKVEKMHKDRRPTVTEVEPG